MTNPIKLETNPVLPLDVANLNTTLARIFRTLASIVNPIVDWTASFVGVTVTQPNLPTDGSTYLTVKPVPYTGMAVLALDSALGTSGGDYINASKNNVMRWRMVMGDKTAETGGNAGSNFILYRFNDAGAVLPSTLTINRASGAINFGSGVSITPAPGNNATLTLNAPASGYACDIVGSVASKTRWLMRLGNASAETGSNAGSDFEIYSYDDSGVMLTSVFSILRANGAVQAKGIGGLTVSNQVAAASGMGFRYDGANANFLAMGTGLATTTWSWQWNRSNGMLTWLGSASQSLFSVDGAGNANAATSFNTSNVSATGRVTAGGSEPAALNASNGGVQVQAPYGMNVNSYTGSNPYTCAITNANPNWNPCYMQALHYPGVWAGHRFNIGGATFDFNNSGQVSCNGVVLTSDARTKTNLQPIADAAAMFANCQAFEYDRVALENLDGTPVHEVGLIAQDIQQGMPMAVLQYAPMPDDPEPLRRLDLGAMNALSAQAIGELLARVMALETEVSQLRAA